MNLQVVGARNLKECLLLQLEKRDQSQPSIKLAHTIIDLYFEEFTKRHYDKIVARMGINEAELKAAIEEVLKLNPKPGGLYSDPYQQELPANYSRFYSRTF